MDSLMIPRSDRKLRVGVIGIGFGQHVHVPAFRADGRCEVAALCASTLERAQRVALRLEIQKAYGDWRRLIDDKEIDAVAISTPPALQATIATAALSVNKHVFCEKPMAASRDAAIAMVAAAEKSGSANMVDFELPEINEWIQAKEILNASTLGRLRHIHVAWYVETYANQHRLLSWKTCTEQGGGTLNSFVSHCFYYLEWLVGPIRKMSG